ncbi:MAG: T9SS type A sorting domain-containing protein [Chitinophagaceae bacterium]|nr:T9SS type A sorting domain-containing protein [Chitinophagaceae bacterium]
MHLFNRITVLFLACLSLPLFLCAQAASTPPAAGSALLTVPAASFTCSDTLVCEDSCVMLVNTTSGTTDSVRWSVSGVLIPSTLSGIPLCFASPGVYEVSLFVYNPSGADTATISVTVIPAPTPVITTIGDTLTVTSTYATYKWYRNGSSIAGATNSKYYPTLPGSYEVKVTDFNGCGAMSDMYTVLSPSSVYNLSAPFTVAPNPATGRMRVTGQLTGMAGSNLHITITDITGRIVSEHEASTTDGVMVKDIDLSAYPAGMYLLQYRWGSDIYGVTRFVVER